MLAFGGRDARAPRAYFIIWGGQTGMKVSKSYPGNLRRAVLGGIEQIAFAQTVIAGYKVKAIRKINRPEFFCRANAFELQGSQHRQFSRLTRLHGGT